MIIAGREKRVQTKLPSVFFMIMFLFCSVSLILLAHLLLWMLWLLIAAATAADLEDILVWFLFCFQYIFLLLLLCVLATVSIIQSRRSLRLVNTIIASPSSRFRALSHASFNVANTNEMRSGKKGQRKRKKDEKYGYKT